MDKSMASIMVTVHGRTRIFKLIELCALRTYCCLYIHHTLIECFFSQKENDLPPFLNRMLWKYLYPPGPAFIPDGRAII